jgi:hypothetical protein
MWGSGTISVSPATALIFLMLLVGLGVVAFGRKTKPPISQGDPSSLVTAVAAGFAPNSGATSLARGSDKAIEAINRYIANPDQFRSVQVSNWNWHRDGFGSLIVPDFTLENKNSFAVADIEITCALFDDNNALIDVKVFQLHQMLKERSSRAIGALNLGYADPRCANSIGFASDFSSAKKASSRVPVRPASQKRTAAEQRDRFARAGGPRSSR